MVLELRPVLPSEDYQSAFAPSVPGFTEHWWNGGVRLASIDFDQFSIVEEGQEVARVKADPESRFGLRDYAGPLVRRPFVDITFFEVRADLRRRGRGAKVAAALVDHYQGKDIIAFSEDADEFWSGIGWTHHPRIDRDTSFRQLYVHHVN